MTNKLDFLFTIVFLGWIIRGLFTQNLSFFESAVIMILSLIYIVITTAATRITHFTSNMRVEAKRVTRQEMSEILGSKD